MPHAPDLVGHPWFHYQNNELHVEQLALRELAEQHGTPLFVYSRAALRAAWQRYADAIAGRHALICFGMKANSNLAVLHTFAQAGAGFDIVSGGELARVLAVGGDPGKVVFSGVGKQTHEMEDALAAGVKCFNVESEAELERLSEVANRMGARAPVSLRVNPDVDPGTHPYISTGLKESKFGIAIEDAHRVYRHATTLPALDVVGVDCHIGSQITDLSPYLAALDKVLDLVERLEHDGMAIRHLDLGGGLGIRYADETALDPGALIRAIFQRLESRGLQNVGGAASGEPRELVLEPGRSLVGNAGVLITRVEYVKPGETKNFAVVDAAMNDLLRPTLYDAWHGIVPVAPRHDPTALYDVVGPICESGDWLGRNRPLALQPGDLLAVESAGAYAMTMGSQYNTRPRAAEILVDGDRHAVVRRRETVAELFASESLMP